MQFSELTQLISQAAEAAQEIMYEAAAARRENLWEERTDDDGQTYLVPKSTTRRIGGKSIEVPRMTQVDIDSVSVDKIKFSLETDIAFRDGEEVVVGLKKDLLKNNATASIEITLKQELAPEGVEALRDKLNTQLKEDLKSI